MQLAHDVDIKDVPNVALTIELAAQLWSNDNALKKGLKAKGFNDVTVDTSTPKMILRGTVAKDKMPELMAEFKKGNLPEDGLKKMVEMANGLIPQYKA